MDHYMMSTYNFWHWKYYAQWLISVLAEKVIRRKKLQCSSFPNSLQAKRNELEDVSSNCSIYRELSLCIIHTHHIVYV